MNDFRISIWFPDYCQVYGGDRTNLDTIAMYAKLFAAFPSDIDDQVREGITHNRALGRTFAASYLAKLYAVLPSLEFPEDLMEYLATSKDPFDLEFLRILTFEVDKSRGLVLMPAKTSSPLEILKDL